MSIADLPARIGANIAIGLTGKAITYVKTGDPTISTDGRATQNVTNYTMKAFETRIKQWMIDGTKIQMGDRLLLVDAVLFESKLGSGVLPSTDDRIIVGSRDWAIVLVDPVSSGEQNALHKIYVRR